MEGWGQGSGHQVVPTLDSSDCQRFGNLKSARPREPQCFQGPEFVLDGLAIPVSNLHEPNRIAVKQEKRREPAPGGLRSFVYGQPIESTN
jgi:hypothetical protein